MAHTTTTLFLDVLMVKNSPTKFDGAKRLKHPVSATVFLCVVEQPSLLHPAGKKRKVIYYIRRVGNSSFLPSLSLSF